MDVDAILQELCALDKQSRELGPDDWCSTHSSRALADRFHSERCSVSVNSRSGCKILHPENDYAALARNLFLPAMEALQAEAFAHDGSCGYCSEKVIRVGERFICGCTPNRRCRHRFFRDCRACPVFASLAAALKEGRDG